MQLKTTTEAKDISSVVDMMIVIGAKIAPIHKSYMKYVLKTAR